MKDFNTRVFRRNHGQINRSSASTHINNTLYYEYMDNAVNNHLIKMLLADTNARIDIGDLQMRFVAESSCQFLRPLQYPHTVDVGLRVSKLGNSAVT